MLFVRRGYAAGVERREIGEKKLRGIGGGGKSHPPLFHVNGKRGSGNI